MKLKKSYIPFDEFYQHISCVQHVPEVDFGVKFIYSEKATKVCKISTLLLSVCTVDKSEVEISQNFVAFSEYTNFKLTFRSRSSKN